MTKKIGTSLNPCYIAGAHTGTAEDSNIQGRYTVSLLIVLNTLNCGKIFVGSCEYGNETSGLSKSGEFNEDKQATNILCCIVLYSPTVLTKLSCSPVFTLITDSYTLSTSRMIVTTAVDATVYASPAQIAFTCIVRCTHTVAMDTLVITPVDQMRM
jgi:hypothetical protein